jgi:hypothetical protein
MCHRYFVPERTGGEVNYDRQDRRSRRTKSFKSVEFNTEALPLREVRKAPQYTDSRADVPADGITAVAMKSINGGRMQQH